MIFIPHNLKLVPPSMHFATVFVYVSVTIYSATLILFKNTMHFDSLMLPAINCQLPTAIKKIKVKNIYKHG